VNEDVEDHAGGRVVAMLLVCSVVGVLFWIGLFTVAGWFW
jgi:hypothetical protein